MAKEKKPIGRPSDKTPEMIDRFINKIMLGESVNKICKAADMPNKDTIYDWLKDDTEFSDKYARAKEISAHVYQEEIIEIADRPKKNHSEVEADKLRVDARKWAAEKLNPKKYGSKIAIDHSGKIETAPPSWVSNSGESL